MTFLCLEKVVAINSYNGFPNPPSGQIALKFNIGDVIDIIGSCNDPSWALVGKFFVAYVPVRYSDVSLVNLSEVIEILL